LIETCIFYKQINKVYRRYAATLLSILEMNSTIDASNKHAFHTIANAEFTGVYDNLIYNFTHTSGSISSYHFFITYGDKVYVEVKGIGEIVLTFAELQKKRYLYYY